MDKTAIPSTPTSHARLNSKESKKAVELSRTSLPNTSVSMVMMEESITSSWDLAPSLKVKGKTSFPRLGKMSSGRAQDQTALTTCTVALVIDLEDLYYFEFKYLLLLFCRFQFK
jgi:hypothetical protein